MYPDLSYIFHALFGTEPDNWLALFKTFGLFLVLSILAAAWLLYHELKRKADEGLFKPTKVLIPAAQAASPREIVTNALFGFALGFKIPHIAQNMAAMQRNAADVLLTAEGNWLIGLFTAAAFGYYQYWLGQKEAAKNPKPRTIDLYPHDRIGDITMIAAIAGVAGAKLFDLIENLPAFFADPLGTLFSGSGLAIYGGLICGFLGVAWYLRRRDIPIIHVMDAVAPALIISYGIGRMGCHFSGDGDWGIVAAAQPAWWFLPDWFWAFEYPHNVLNAGVKIEGCTYQYCSKLVPAVYPTPIYEIIASFAIGGILWALRKRLTVPGMLFFLYMIFNGIERFWIEKIRVNSKYELLGVEVTQAEIIAVVFILIGIAGCTILWQRRPKTAV